MNQRTPAQVSDLTLSRRGRRMRSCTGLRSASWFRLRHVTEWCLWNYGSKQLFGGWIIRGWLQEAKKLLVTWFQEALPSVCFNLTHVRFPGLMGIPRRFTCFPWTLRCRTCRDDGSCCRLAPSAAAPGPPPVGAQKKSSEEFFRKLPQSAQIFKVQRLQRHKACQITQICNFSDFSWFSDFASK